MSRKSAKNFLKQVKNPYPTESQSYTAWEKGFNEGFDSGLCMPCFSEEDMIDFIAFMTDNYYYNVDFWCNRKTGKSIESIEIFNLWIQSKSNHNDLETNINE